MSNMRFEDEFDQVLDSCLNMLQAGDSVDDCVGRYPAYGADLRPILELSSQVMRVPAPRASAPALDKNRARMLGAVESGAISGDAGRPRLLNFLQPVSFPNVGRYASQLYQFITGKEVTPAMKITRSLAMLAALIFSFAFTVNASADSLPGDMLYSVKRLSEETMELLAPPARAAEIRQQQTTARLTELDALLKQNRDGTLNLEGDITITSDGAILIDGVAVELPVLVSVAPAGYSELELHVVGGQVVVVKADQDGVDSSGPVEGYPAPTTATNTPEPPPTERPTDYPSPAPATTEPTPPATEPPTDYPSPTAESQEAIDPIDQEQIDACFELKDEDAIEKCLDALYEEAFPEIYVCFELEDDEAVDNCLDNLYDEIFPEATGMPEWEDPIDEEKLDACLELEDDAAVDNCLDNLYDEVFPEATDMPEWEDPIEEEDIDACFELEDETAIQKCFGDLYEEIFPELPEGAPQPEPPGEEIPGGYPEPPFEASESPQIPTVEIPMIDPSDWNDDDEDDESFEMPDMPVIEPPGWDDDEIGESFEMPEAPDWEDSDNDFPDIPEWDDEDDEDDEG